MSQHATTEPTQAGDASRFSGVGTRFLAIVATTGVAVATIAAVTNPVGGAIAAGAVLVGAGVALKRALDGLPAEAPEAVPDAAADDTADDTAEEETQEKDEEAVRRAAELVAQARELARTVDADATQEETLQVSDASAAVGALLGDPPSPEQIKLAEDALEQLKLLLETLAKACADARRMRAERAASIRELAERAPASLDADASDTERQDVGNAVLEVTGALRDPVSPPALSAGESALKALNLLVAGIAARCDSDRKRRREARKSLAQRVADAKPDSAATDDEKRHLLDLAKPVAGLAETPSDAALREATSAAEAVEKTAAELALAVAERRLRFAKAAALLPRLKPDAAGLQPHARAPAGEAAPVLKDSEKLRVDAAKFGDWAFVTSWAESELSGLERAIVALEQRMADVNKATADRILRVDEAAARATEAVASAKGRAFSAAQRSTLLGAVQRETERFAHDIAAADSVIQALQEQAKTSAALSVALSGLAKRLGAVAKPDETQLSQKEKDALTKARVAAEQSLDAVTEA